MTQFSEVNAELIYESIKNELVRTEYFQSFKWLKSKKALIFKDKGIEKRIFLKLYLTVENADSDELGYELTAYSGIRFSILYKWFEKFYQGSTIKDLRNNSTFIKFIVSTNSNLPEIFFFQNGSNLTLKVNEAFQHISKESLRFYEEHKYLSVIYSSYIVPVLENKTKLGLVGCFWMFEYLAICKIIAPENLDKLDAILYNHLQFLYERNEPNALNYFPIYKEALDELKRIKL